MKALHPFPEGQVRRPPNSNQTPPLVGLVGPCGPIDSRPHGFPTKDLLGSSRIQRGTPP